MNRGTQCDYTVVTAGTDRLLYTRDYACIVKLCKLKSDHPCKQWRATNDTLQWLGYSRVRWSVLLQALLKICIGQQICLACSTPIKKDWRSGRNYTQRSFNVWFNLWHYNILYIVGERSNIQGVWANFEIAKTWRAQFKNPCKPLQPLAYK